MPPFFTEDSIRSVLIGAGCFLALLVSMGALASFRTKIRLVNLSFGVASICFNSFLLWLFVREANADRLADWSVLVPAIAVLATLAGMAISLTRRP